MKLLRFLQHIERTQQNRALMARIVLNTLGHHQRCPVDLSELRQLSPENRALVNAFEEWAFSETGCIIEGRWRVCAEEWACGFVGVKVA